MYTHTFLCVYFGKGKNKKYLVTTRYSIIVFHVTFSR